MGDLGPDRATTRGWLRDSATGATLVQYPRNS